MCVIDKVIYLYKCENDNDGDDNNDQEYDDCYDDDDNDDDAAQHIKPSIYLYHTTYKKINSKQITEFI